MSRTTGVRSASISVIDLSKILKRKELGAEPLAPLRSGTINGLIILIGRLFRIRL